MPASAARMIWIDGSSGNGRPINPTARTVTTTVTNAAISEMGTGPMLSGARTVWATIPKRREPGRPGGADGEGSGGRGIAGDHESEPDQGRRKAQPRTASTSGTAPPGRPAPAATRSSPTPGPRQRAAARKAPACTRRSRHSRAEREEAHDGKNDGALDRVALGEQDEDAELDPEQERDRGSPAPARPPSSEAQRRSRRRRPRRRAGRMDARPISAKRRARSLVSISGAR